MNNSLLNKADIDWLDKIHRKSKSDRSRTVAEISLKTFDIFCKDQGMERHSDKDTIYGYIPQMIEQFKVWYNPKPDPQKYVRPDINSICNVLDRFVGFMDIEHRDIIISTNKQKGKETFFKKKAPKTIQLYFSWIKIYLRSVHSIKIASEDVKELVTFPNQTKYQREALTLKQLKVIMDNSSSRRRCLYYILVSSGMRVGEALTLTPANIFLKENPVRVKLYAENTKTNEERETYLSAEAVEKVKPFLEGLKEDERIFKTTGNIVDDVSAEDRVFGYLREKLGYTEKYKGSVRYKIRIHGMRSYFHTKASQKHSTEYANALDGHTGYLEQYYNLTPEERAEKYKELEPELLIESVKVESDHTKDKIIDTLREDMDKMKDEMDRILKTPNRIVAQ
ncbi:MAG: site-specific integrase [Nitrosopumilus sp.]|nr:site-specific integrase [Nitrosopumilus sp.]NRA05933.1 site-specific integrase [Nitrosopumilus sp.]